MSGPSTIGALRVVLGLDSAAFTNGLKDAQAQLRKAGRQFEQIGSQLQGIGQSMTVGVTAPLLAFGVGALKASADFESAMIKVGISTKAAGAEMSALEASAREIGKSTVFSASEAADAMDMLAKTGLGVAEILGGAAKATVDLAAAAGSELDPAASAISDSMQQFKLTAAQLPGVVNQITGAVNESKLDFQDFTLAIGQAGGVAAGLGVSFEDFNAVLAGTSSLFSSGSDAGTSFKTFLTTLVPKTKGAAEAMDAYGLTFFDANGAMKDMADIAEMLRTQLGGLSEEAKNEALTKIFGTDAMRTAIGLMDQGADGIESLKVKIAETDAAAQSAQRMTGFAGQMEQLKGSLEELGIAIGKSGLLDFMTKLVTGLSGFIDKVSATNPELLKLATIAGAVAAAIGPLVMIAGAVVGSFGTLLGLLTAPVTLPIVGAIAGVAVAFAVFGDTIIPALQDFGQRVAEILGPKIQPLFEAVVGLVGTLSAAFAAAFGQGAPGAVALQYYGEQIARVFGAAVDLITGAVNVITNVLKAIGALLRGDFAGAWTYVGEAIFAALKGIVNAVSTLLPEVVQWVKATYEGVRTWFGTMLPRVFEGVKSKVKEVGDAFFDLYDRVVGHSYVPDMVEGVASWMAKLDAGMVKPAKGATKAATEAFETLRSDVASIMEGLLTDSERTIRDLNAKMLELRKMVAEGRMRDGEFSAAVDRMFEVEVKPSKTKPVGTGEDITRPWEGANEAWEEAVEEREKVWTDSLGRMGTSFKGMFQEWISTGKVNWKRFLFDMADNWEGIMGALKKSGGLGGLFGGEGGLGSILGKIGGSLGGGLGKAWSGITGALGSLGSGIGGVVGKIGTALGGMTGGIGSAIGGLASSIGGALGGVATSMGAALAPLLGVLGPVGIIAGLGSMLLKSKPSNNAALATFDGAGYSVSGNKRTDETTSAASAAADAVAAGQDALRAFGISLGTTVRQIDIGTRDLTHVFLSSGQELRTAVGDPAAAAEAALKAVLAGATFTDEAQKTLVTSMLAAGKGFDEIATGLQSFAQAQLIPKTISDQILKLMDPAAFDTKSLVGDQQARRAEIQKQLDTGLLTAQQFAAIAEQLTQLEGLELGQVVAQYAGQLSQAADREAAVDKARSALQAAYQKTATPLQAAASKLRSIESDLRSYGERLRGDALSFASPGDRFAAAESEFARVSALAQLGNDAAFADLERVGDAYVQASLDFQPELLDHLKVIGAVLNAVEGAKGTAGRQASIAEQQLAALDAQVAGQLETTEAVLSVGEAMANLAKALEGRGSGQQLGLNPASNSALAAATGFKGDFGAGGWQAWIIQQDEQTKAIARHILGAFGQTERIVGFATGGSFKVGGSGGIDSQLMQFRATPGEMVQVSRPGKGDDTANAVRQLRSELVPAVQSLALSNSRIESHFQRAELEGWPVRGELPGSPVLTKVA
jgi:TP901 family phage tail tape measure protein